MRHPHKVLVVTPATAPTKFELAPNDGLGVIAHAYALVWTPTGHVAVHLEGVTAEKVTYLEPNGRPEQKALAASRIANSAERRKEWGKT